MSVKNILLVDDSALMRRVLCDIINSDKRFRVADIAPNGMIALELLKQKEYDAVVLDVNMPVMNGIELLEALRKHKISARVMMASSDNKESTKNSFDALELGALDFILKPNNAALCRDSTFVHELLRVLNVVANTDMPVFQSKKKILESRNLVREKAGAISQHAKHVEGSKVIALACSTGGPKALQSVIPELPATLNAPVLVVQHMPVGFTAALAERLNSLSALKVKEAEHGEELKKGVVYLAMGGKHMNIKTSTAGKHTILYSDEPNREGVKPCANYMYESLSASQYDEIICIVMTGMGADATAGIKNLKNNKKVQVIVQNMETCTVYGMPKSIVANGLADQEVSLDNIAREIILNVGVM